MVLAFLFAPSTLVLFKKQVIADDLVPIYIDIKPNLVTVPHMNGTWLNSIEVRGDVNILYQMLVVFRLIS